LEGWMIKADAGRRRFECVCTQLCMNQKLLKGRKMLNPISQIDERGLFIDLKLAWAIYIYWVPVWPPFSEQLRWKREKENVMRKDREIQIMAIYFFHCIYSCRWLESLQES
jgi:hypothetical protein